MSYSYPEQFSFPVMGYHVADGKAYADNLFGSASYMNNNIFITAAHSIINSQGSDCSGIVFRDNLERESGFSFHKIDEVEIFQDLDLGLVRLISGHSNAIANKWSKEQSFILEDVQTVGYPFGYDNVEGKIIPRGLKGHIVTHRSFNEFPTRPHAIELSFHCPKGISGSSLRRLKDDRIIGFIIGNAATEILVFEEKEINESDNMKTVYEKYETTKYGIAISINNLLKIDSKILGMSFESYLTKEDLI